MLRMTYDELWLEIDVNQMNITNNYKKKMRKKTFFFSQVE